MNGKVGDDPFVSDLEDAIQKVKGNRKWRDEYMMLTAFEMDAKRKGRKEGIIIGENRGENKKGMTVYINVRKRGMSIADAQAIGDIPDDLAKRAEEKYRKGKK